MQSTLSPAQDANAQETRRQSLRVRRLLMGAATAMLLPLVLLMSAALGQSGYPVAAWSAALMTGVSLVFYAAFRIGANLRFRDPSLTAQTIFCAILCVALISYWADKARPAVEKHAGLPLS